MSSPVCAVLTRSALRHHSPQRYRKSFASAHYLSFSWIVMSTGSTEAQVFELLKEPRVAGTAYIIRHGERIDQIDPTWASTSKYPFDPPLTDLGIRQARKT